MVNAAPTPASVDELLHRAHALAGYSMLQLAHQLGVNAAVNLRREKGWTGQLLELALGANSGSLAQPDFPQWGIEMKSIPVDEQGRALESTWVCVAPLLPADIKPWPHSLVCAKLNQVLWIPVLATRNTALQQRTIGHAFLWTPNEQQHTQLQRDYDELTERIALGEIDSITAHHGVALQLRPKAANKHATTTGINRDGQAIQTAPRGFYLRRRFTQSLLNAHFL